MRSRKCEGCDADLTDEDVMRIKDEKGQWHVIPLPLCPICFTRKLRKKSSDE